MSGASVIRIDGNGVAACVFARISLLRRDVLAWRRGPARGERYVAIEAATVALLNEMFDVDIAALTPSRWLRKRRMAWEAGATPFSIEAPALVCDVEALIERLTPRMLRDEVGAPDWLVCASGRVLNDGVVSAGQRRGVLAHMAPPDGFELDCAYVVATPFGWLFAAARADGRVALTCVHPLDIAEPLPQALAYVWPAHKAELVIAAAGDAAPAYAPCCAAPGLLAIGDAALALDPLRGDGVGFAIRGALLAHAATNTCESAGQRAQWLDHYKARLSAVFASHLRNCVSHYERAAHSSIWANEIAAMRGALAALAPVKLDFVLSHA